MKVAIVQETLDPGGGGAETSTWEMARQLARLGLEVTVICRAVPPAQQHDPEVRVVALATPGWPRALRTYRFLQAVHRLHLRGRFHVIHAVTPCLSANVYQPRGGTYAETRQRSLDLTVSPAWRAVRWLGQRFNLRQSFLLRMERALLTRRRGQVFVAAVSEYVRRQVIGWYGFPPDGTRVVFNGVDIAPLAAAEAAAARAAVRGRLGIAADTPVALFVGHNFKLKGLGELLRACAASARRPELAVRAEWAVVVAGRDRSGPYQRLARQLGVGARCHFVGAQTRMREWYAAADVLAHPTWYDPCSRVVLEALSLGLPVVTTRLNGAAEVMEAGRHGEVVDAPGNVTVLADAIGRALRPEVRAACRADAPRLCQELSMERHARELKAFYQLIVAATR